jgi:hypothetical protein
VKCIRKQIRGYKLERDTMSFESGQSFKYLGSVVNQKNTIEEEIKERIINWKQSFLCKPKNVSN